MGARIVEKKIRNENKKYLVKHIIWGQNNSFSYAGNVYLVKTYQLFLHNCLQTSTSANNLYQTQAFYS